MQKSRSLSTEQLLAACVLAGIGLIGGWAGGTWNDAAPGAQQASPTQAATYGPEPEADARAGVPDVCSRRIGCLAR